LTTFKFTLAYDGTDFVGWQRQASGRSVQALLEEALSRIEGAPVAIVGAGRTDAGVHALGQVASATLSHRIGAAALRRALNATLPPDLRVLEVEPKAAAFNARYAARSKRYRYHIVCDEIIGPFDRRFAWHVSGPLDLAAMRGAARRLEGRHDFLAFQSTSGRAVRTVRTIMCSRLTASPVSEGGTEIIYDVTGDGFLRHMVRVMVGTLIEIGRGRLNADEIDEIIASRDRRQAGPTAPAHGLFLVEVAYGPDQEMVHASPGPA
jgi:tRNA pseudouridine38-40 synthase